jgi:hypothetical protein
MSLRTSIYWKLLPEREKEKIRKSKAYKEGFKLGTRQEKERIALIKKVKGL